MTASEAPAPTLVDTLPSGRLMALDVGGDRHASGERYAMIWACWCGR